MASPENIQKRKRELVSELATMRSEMGATRSRLTRRLRPVHGLSHLLGKHPLRTFGLTCLATGLLTMLLRRKPKPQKQAKPRATVKRFAFSTLLGAAQPIAKRWVIYMVKKKYGDRFYPPSDDSLLGQ